MEKKANHDEIDLLDLFLKAVNIFRSNVKIIVICFVMGCALGMVHYYLSPRIYENKLIISSSILTESYAKKLIENVQKFIDERNHTALATRLGLSEDEARKIFFVRIENLSDIQADALKENDRYLITTQIGDQSILQKLQQGLVNYFENNDFVKIRVEHNKDYLKQMISKIQQEIKDLEALKLRIHNGDFFENTKGNVSFDPTTVNSKILDLTKERINLEHSLEVVNSVQVIDDFTPFEKPIRPKRSISLTAGATLGLFFAGMFISFKIIRKTLRMADAAKLKA